MALTAHFPSLPATTSYRPAGSAKAAIQTQAGRDSKHDLPFLVSTK
jgi:hypothetical protein